jgi:hypothetical protein
MATVIADAISIATSQDIGGPFNYCEMAKAAISD